MIELPMSLATALWDGSCVLFLGAGVGHNSTSPIGSGLGLRDYLAKRFELTIGETEDLSLVSQVIELRHDRKKLIGAINDALKDAEPDDDLVWLTSLPWRAIYTTNYDQLIERCYEINPRPAQRPVVMGANCEVRSWQPPFEVPLIHLHGSIQSEASREAILVTRKDYAQYRTGRGMLFDYLRTDYSSSPIVYVGYSNRDPNWDMVISEVQAQFGEGRPPTSFRIAPATSDHERLVLDSVGVSTLDGSIKDLRDAWVDRYGAELPTVRASKSLEDSVPQDLVGQFQTEPAGTARLLNAWEYVNQAPFDEPPNTYEFHRGEQPNWGLLAQGIGFERDLESELVERLLDFATDPNSSSKCDIVLSPAGWGVTTLLLSVSAWFARQNTDTSILWLRPGQSPQISDIQFALRSLGRPMLLVIDDAADFGPTIDEIWDLAKKSAIPIFLLLGERSNEWRSSNIRVHPLEWEMQPLSDGEIDRLLASLESASALGRLADLTPAVRMAAIKTRNQKDLLVTMREVTEGRAFDAIIEDEYRGIRNPNALNVYNHVCAVSRVGALARDFMLMDAARLESSNFYPAIREDLRGIVKAELVDEARGVYAYSCRHSIIANIVWTRCIDEFERREILSRVVSGFNLTYFVDAKAFEALTRDEEGMDHLGGFDAKAQFFENACRKAGRSAFVRQHYARMLRRERKYELALGQIKQAVSLNPRARAIQHTRGVILADLAINAATDGVGRKWLAQSEEAFKKAITANPRDAYSWRSLADLYLNWAKRSKSDEEATGYAAKAQDVVDEGLSKAATLEGLYVAASNIEEYLGNTPERIEALRSAVSVSPDSKVPRYLLGVVLTREGEYAEARSVLEGGMAKWPDDPGMAIAYGTLVYVADGNAAAATSILRLAQHRASTQPRYIATLGGMLVMDGCRGEAEELFSGARNLPMAGRDLNRTLFVPNVRGERPTFTGVVRLEGGRSRVEAPGYPGFFVRASLLENCGCTQGSTVTFAPAFSARGPVAQDVSAT